MSIKNINIQKIIFLFIIISFFVGIWHALPMLKVVGDEMYFVGGVLRAMENYTIIPAVNDVPYGILTYFLNYILIAIFLLSSSPWFNFNILNLKLYLIANPEIIYLIIRFLSALISVAFLFLINKLLKKEVKLAKNRIFLVLILFTNMLVSLVLHTGKMWVLSTFLVMASFYFLYLILNKKSQSIPPKNSHIFLTLLLGFLAVANCPFYAFAFINIPIVFIYFWQNKKILLKITKYLLISIVIFIVILAFNFNTTKNLLIIQFTYYNPILDHTVVNNNLNILSSIWLNFKKIILFFPLLLVVLISVINRKLKNKELFNASAIYFLAYFLSISLVATWSTGIYTYIRYLFPLAFFIITMIASFDIQFKKYFYIIAIISLIYFIPTIYFLSASTTLNQARNWIVENINNENNIIENQIRSLDLPKNKKSYLLTADNYCASQCENIIKYDLNNYFKPLIIDKYTQVGETGNNDLNHYLIVEKPAPENSDLILIKSFTNPPQASYNLDGHMANYFDLNFFRIKNFGPDIYIYQQE